MTEKNESQVAHLEELTEKAKQAVFLMREMKREFEAMQAERQKLVATREALDKLFPAMQKVTAHVAQLYGHVKILMKAQSETLMKAREAKTAELIRTPIIKLRPSVSGQPCAKQVDDCWEQGSRPPTIGGA